MLLANLNGLEKKAVNKVVQHLLRVYPDQLISVILYGSKARGNHSDESDVDLLILVRSRENIDRNKIYDFLLDDDLEYELNLSLNIYGVEEFQRLVKLKAPFAKNVMEDGEPLWTS